MNERNVIMKQIVTAVLITACVSSLSYGVAQRATSLSLVKPLAEHTVQIQTLQSDVREIRSASLEHMKSVTSMLAEQARQSTEQARQSAAMLELARTQTEVIQKLHEALLNRRMP